jgi:hypothetical protein
MEGRKEKHGGRVSKPYSWRIAQKLRANRRRSAVGEVERAAIYEECDKAITRYLTGKDDEDGTTVGMVGDEEHSPIDVLSHVDLIRMTARKLWPKRVGVLIKGTVI